MKGILICGGTGSRLKPLTEITNKSLLPVYDKPLIEYPLGTLRSAGITEIFIVTGPEHMDQIANYLGDGARFGCRFSFAIQQEPKGIAQALGLAESFADGQSVCAILGDNIFFDDLSPALKAFKTGGHVFLKEVPDPQRFGVAEVKGDTVISIEEKPAKPKSSLAQTGCYLFDNRCFEIIKNMKPSARGELEITDVTRKYLESNELAFTLLKDEWVDA
ncbi:MAG: sugar phosphate nucleotidyltransferase, partial [Candidatus Peribacteraceae bacterium]|nr:sugar phosphate nucleotidyltransferase [Candidatus Peribacteraceae bacterium]